VLITGGTKGIGLGIALSFASRGASVFLTQKWGSADPDELRALFRSHNAVEPEIMDADVAHDEDAQPVIEAIRDRHGHLDVLISNVAFAPVIHGLDEYTRRGLMSAIDHSTWPIVAYTRAAREICGRYPRYVIGLSSEGADTYHMHYDIIAASKAALEAMCRYLHQRLREHDSRVNVVRTRFTDTDSLRAITGDEFVPFVEKHSPGTFTTPNEVGESVVGLCSGLMDAVGGQIITVDHGASIFENFSRLFNERERNPIKPARPQA
jgi:NAD(P)-dependent dehydrogenase (short-subunit alcohol dehydrogenase family)